MNELEAVQAKFAKFDEEQVRDRSKQEQRALRERRATRCASPSSAAATCASAGPPAR